MLGIAVHGHAVQMVGGPDGDHPVSRVPFLFASCPSGVQISTKFVALDIASHETMTFGHIDGIE